MVIDRIELMRRPGFEGRFEHWLQITCGNDVFDTPKIVWSPNSGFKIGKSAGQWVAEEGDNLVSKVHVGDDIDIKARFDGNKLTHVQLEGIACHAPLQSA